MPITLKSTQINIKGSDGYIPLDAFAEETTSEKIAAINAAATQKISAIEEKGAQTLASIPQDYTSLENEVDELKSDFDVFVTQEKAIDFSKLTYGRVSINSNYNWNPSSGSNLGSSYIIPLTDVDKIFIVKNNNESLSAQVSFLRTYDPSALSGAVDGYGLVTIPVGETVTLTRPSDALYFYVWRSASTGIVRTPDVTIGYQLYVTPDVYKTDKAIIDGHVLGNKTYTQYRGTNATGEFSYQSVKRGNIVKFRCNFSVLGELTVGYKNVNDAFSTYVIIDADNIRIKMPNVTEISTPHGLTITNEYTVTIYNDIEKIYITLESGGNAYTYNRVWTAGYLKPSYSLTGSTFTSVDFTFSNVDISRDIWMFGDSYFSYGENRWVYYLVTENNSNNCMIDAYAGEGSERAINSFNYLTSIATPKYLIWALGMNDGSDGENPDTTWKTDLDHVLEVCKEKGITPVLCTIPTVSIKNHEKKNEYVRNSGHIYIDFAQAVGADANGNWYSGMLSSDGVHPTVVGAKTLYQQALADFPVFTYK